MLNIFNPRWWNSAAGGQIQCLREQFGLRPKLRCAPQKVLKTWSFLTTNILKREKPKAGENSLIKLTKSKWSLDQMTVNLGHNSSRLSACSSTLSSLKQMTSRTFLRVLLTLTGKLGRYLPYGTVPYGTVPLRVIRYYANSRSETCVVINTPLL